MIYRHYKGGLYYVIGYVTKLSEGFIGRSLIENVTVAIHTEDPNQNVTIVKVKDKRSGAEQFCFEDKNLNGVYVLYKDIYGGFWLRPREMFVENVLIDNEEKPRFSKVSGEYLFDTISEMVSVANECYQIFKDAKY